MHLLCVHPWTRNWDIALNKLVIVPPRRAHTLKNSIYIFKGLLCTWHCAELEAKKDQGVGPAQQELRAKEQQTLAFLVFK
jgi:hypothetical protein